MPRNWLRNLTASMKNNQVRRRIRKAAATQSALVQSLEQRVLLAVPRISPNQNLSFQVTENVGVNGFVQNAFTPNAVSDNYIDPVTGVSVQNLSNGAFLGSFTVDANDAGQVVTTATVPGLNGASPISVRLVGQTVEMYVNNFEHFNIEATTTIPVTINLRDNAATPEAADVTVNVTIVGSSGTNDIPYISLGGLPNTTRDYQNFSIDENAAAGTVTTGLTDDPNSSTPGVMLNAGGVLHARTAVVHEPTNTSFVGNLSPNGINAPTGTLIPGQATNNDGTRTDLSGQTDTVSLDGTEFQTLRYEIVRASTTTTTNGSGVNSEVQRILKDFDLEAGQFLLSFASDQTVQTVTEGANPSTNEVQQLDFGNVTNGSFYTLTFRTNGNPSNSFTTRPIYYTATAAEVRAELELLGGIGVNNVNVTDIVQVAETTKGGASNEVQTISIPTAPKNNQFFLNFNGQTTTAIAANADGATVQAALEALSGIGAGNVSVTGMAGGPYVVTFQGALANIDVNAIRGIGGFNITFQGSLSGADQNQLVMTSYTTPLSYVSTPATIQAALRALPTAGIAGNTNIAVNNLVSVATTQNGSPMLMLNEIQTVTVNDPANTPSFRLNLTTGSGTFTTVPIASNASAATVQAILQTLPNIGTGNVLVTGTPGNYTIEFVGTLANTNFNPLANTEGWTINFQNGLQNMDVSQVGVLNLSDMIEISNDLPTLGRISVSPTVLPFMVGSRLDGANGLNSGFEFLRDYFGLTSGAGDNTVDFLALIRTFDRSGTDPLTQAKTDLGLSLTYDEYVRITVNDASEAAPTVQDEVYTINESAPNSGTVNGLIVGKLNDFNNVVATTTTPATMGGNETQTITATTTGATNPGSYALRFRGQQTSRILYTDNANTIRAKLEALSTIGAGNVMVADDGNLTDGTNTYTITFQGALGQEDVPLLEVFNGVTDGDNASVFNPSEVFRYSFVPGANGNGAFAINNTTGEITVANASLLNFESGPSYRLLVNVTDTAAVLPLTTVVAVDVNLNDINEQTTVNPNQNFIVRENALIGTVVGSVGFSDLDLPQVRSLVFEITNGNLTDSNNVPTFAIDPSTGQITVLSNELLNFETQPFFDLGIRITDRGDQNTLGVGTVRISVSDVNESVPVLDDQTFTIDEDTPSGTVVRLFSGISFEPTQIVTYQLLTMGVPFGITNTNPTSTTNQGQITLSSAIDYELGPRRYDLLVRASDGQNPGLFDTAIFTIFVNDVNEQIDIATQTRMIAENSPAGTNVGAPVAVTEPDDADGVLQGKFFQIVAGNTNNAFSINASTGQIQVNNPAALNFETQGSDPFQLAIQVTDNGSPMTSDIAFVNISVTDVNDAPVIQDQFFSILEHSAPDTLVDTVVASDQDVGQTLTYSIVGGNTGNAFYIDDASGDIFVLNPGALDFAMNPTINLVVRVTDNGSPMLTDTAIVTITVTESTMPEPPIINDTSFNLPENSPLGTVVGNVFPNPMMPGGTAPFNFSITSGNGTGFFQIDSSGNLIVNDPSVLNFEANPTFVLGVLVTDSSNPQLADTATITVNLQNVNEEPVITSGNTFTVAENAPNNTVVGQVVATDPDMGQSLTYAINGGSPIFNIDASGVIFVKDSSLVDFETTGGSVDLLIRVRDNGNPQLTTLQNVTINITNVNEAPVITPPANPFATLAENTANGTAVGNVVANDPDMGDTIAYAITGGNTGNAFTIDSQTGAITVANSAALDFETTPSFSLTVTATDNGMLVDTDTFVINLTDVNEAPLISPQTFSVAENSAPGTILGTVVASDPEGTALTYKLLAAGNTGNAFGIVAATGELFVKNRGPLDAEVNPVFSLTVMVSDAGGQSSMATITVNLDDENDAPVIAPQAFNVAENTVAGTVVGQIAASDPDAPAQTLTYSILSGNTGNAFGITAGGQLFVMNRAPLDFEVNPVFSLTVQVTDNGSPALSSTAVVTINLTDVNEQPVIAPQQFIVEENANAGTVVGTVVASDPDAGQSLTYAIISGNTGNAFTINQATGAITVANSTVIDLETNPVFSLTVQVTDNGSPNLSASAVMTISVGDLNEPPVVPPQSFNVLENSASGTVVGTVSASDPDLPAQTLTYQIVGGNTGNAFGINVATGQIFVKNRAPLDFETNPIFDLEVRVTDSGSPAASTIGNVTINLLDGNDTPEVPSQSFTLPENSPLGTAVGLVQVNDPDVGQGRSYAIVGGNVGNAFTVDSTNGLITVRTPAALNFEANPVITLTVQVTDFGQPRLSSTGVITINLTNVNEAPVFSPTQQLFTVNENSAVNTVVGTLNVIDPDVGDTRSFAITGGNVNNAFGINTSTGQIFVANPAALDFEALNTFSLSVSVTDAGGLTANGTAKINLANVNDPPIITPATFTINENANVGTVVGTVSSTDQDSAQLKSYSIIGGNTGSAFTINAANGQITVSNKAALDFETNPTFNLQVRVTDNGSPAASSVGTITVNLRNQNDAPVVSPATFAVRTRAGVGTSVGTVTATDQDAGQTRTFSIVSGNTNNTFAINASTGAITVSRSPRFNTTFNLVVRATDNGTPAASGQATITILVNSTGTVPLTVANTTSKTSSGSVSTANATATGSAATVTSTSVTTTAKKSSTVNWWELTN